MGKTTELIEEANKLQGYNLIVCYDLSEVKRIWEIIQEKKYDIPLPISFREFIKGRFGVHVNSFLIDNADMLLQQLAKGGKISAITINKETWLTEEQIEYIEKQNHDFKREYIGEFVEEE